MVPVRTFTLLHQPDLFTYPCRVPIFSYQAWLSEPLGPTLWCTCLLVACIVDPRTMYDDDCTPRVSQEVCKIKYLESSSSVVTVSQTLGLPVESPCPSCTGMCQVLYPLVYGPRLLSLLDLCVPILSSMSRVCKSFTMGLSHLCVPVSSAWSPLLRSLRPQAPGSELFFLHQIYHPGFPLPLELQQVRLWTLLSLVLKSLTQSAFPYPTTWAYLPTDP